MSRRTTDGWLLAAAVGAGLLLLGTNKGDAARGARYVKDSAMTAFGKYFTLGELYRSETADRLGIDNTPPPAAEANLRRLVDHVLDPVRRRVATPVRVRSGYRTADLNTAVKGSDTSQHMAGEAVDIKADGMTGEQLAAAIVASGVPFDQVIWYAPSRGGHVHVSYTETRANRRQVKYAPSSGGYVDATPRGA